MKRSMYRFLPALFLLAGCTADEQPNSGTSDGLVPIGICVSEPSAASSRATTGVQKVQFDEGEVFSVTFSQGSAVLSDGQPLSATTFTADGRGGTTPAEQPFFETSATETTLHAYYPQAMSPATTMFTVEADQTSDEAYKQSDLMYATATAAKSGTSVNVHLQFEHKFAKIILMATASGEVGKIYSARLVGCYRGISFSDAATCTFGPYYSAHNSSDDCLTMYRQEAGDTMVVCAAVMPPQTVDERFIELDTDKGIYAYDLSKKLEGGHTYTIALNPGATKQSTTTVIESPGVVFESDKIAIAVSGETGCTYSGEAMTPAVAVTDKETGALLSEGSDYQLVYMNNVNAGQATVFAVGLRAPYIGEAVSTTFAIAKASGAISFTNDEVTGNMLDIKTNVLNKTGDGLVVYRSSNENVVRVNAATGRLSYVGAGTATITATVADGTNYSYASRRATYTVSLSEVNLSDLKSWTIRGNFSADFLGWFVRRDGTLHIEREAEDVGFLAYYDPVADMDGIIPGSRIIVLAVEPMGEEQWTTLNGLSVRPTSTSGYTNSQNVQSYGPDMFPAIYAAWSNATKIPTGSSHWFLPSKEQWTLIASHASQLPLPEGSYWTSTAATSGVKAYYVSFPSTTQNTIDAKQSCKVLPCFIY